MQLPIIEITYMHMLALDITQAHPENYQHLLDGCNVSVPIFHSYAHESTCQYAYNPRNKEGMGFTDGENIEWLWSYFGRFSKMSKEMSAANQTDLLSNALYHYCTLKESKVGVCSCVFVCVYSMHARLCAYLHISLGVYGKIIYFMSVWYSEIMC